MGANDVPRALNQPALPYFTKEPSMSVIDDAFNGDETRTQRVLNVVTHWMLWAIAVQAVLRVPWYFGHNSWALDLGGWLCTVLIILSQVHNLFARLCVKCMEAVPADAGQRAQRQQSVLWLSHSLTSLRGFGLYAIACVGVSMLVASGFPRLITVPLDLFTTTFLYSLWLHHKLRPWCPYCRRWDDGGEHEPSPDPVAKATR